MRWNRGHRSDDVIVRRGGAGGGGGGLFGVLLGLIGSRFGLIGVALAVGAYFLLSNTSFLSQTEPAQEQTAVTGDPRVEFVSFVFDDAQETWTRIFAEGGQTYRRSKMVLFEGSTSTGCGYGDSATGPFYCPRDQHVYLDLTFFRALEQRLGAPGDFAQAYVIAHEVGHHVQTLMGIRNPGVAMELQADCLAGVWAHSTGQRDLLEAGDVEEALGAATAVGDDTLQKKSQGTVQPETFTHGSAAQRRSWFRRGYETGQPSSCDTSSEPAASR